MRDMEMSYWECNEFVVEIYCLNRRNKRVQKFEISMNCEVI